MLKIKNMAITQSAKKAWRQSIRRRARNLVYKNKIKILIKKARLLVSQNKKGEAKSLLPQIYKILDKAAKTNVIKYNAASRKKSRISKLIAKSQ
jgi:small subunit ribosomal protein S20